MVLKYEGIMGNVLFESLAFALLVDQFRRHEDGGAQMMHNISKRAGKLIILLLERINLQLLNFQVL